MATNLISTTEMKDYFGTVFNISLDEEIFNLRDEAQKIRRHIHSNAELSFQEFETSKFIINYLNNLNKQQKPSHSNQLTIKTGAKLFTDRSQTAVVCCLNGKGSVKPFPSTNSNPKSKTKSTYCIGIRADIDALPIEETTDERYPEIIKFKSHNTNVMHACGHDAHITILLLTIKVLQKYSYNIPSNYSIKFLFQPGEEVGGGALDMIASGEIDEIDEIYGLHVVSIFDNCSIGLNKEPKTLMSGCTNFKLIINGKGGHGSMPHLSNDVTIALANVIQQFQTIISRSLNPNSMGVITIGKIESGYKCNVIADKAILEGTIRYYNNANDELIGKRMNEILTGIELGFNGIKTELIYPTPKYPPTINFINGHKNICDTAVKIVGKNGLSMDVPSLPGSEDFSEFLNYVKNGAFFFLGARIIPPKGKGTGKAKEKENENELYMHHASDFKIDERCMVVGCQMFVQLVFDIIDKADNSNSQSESDSCQMRSKL